VARIKTLFSALGRYDHYLTHAISGADTYTGERCEICQCGYLIGERSFASQQSKCDVANKPRVLATVDMPRPNCMCLNAVCAYTHVQPHPLTQIWM
jgi:hypothetical protein